MASNHRREPAQFKRLRSWLRIGLRGAIPAWVGLLLLVAGGVLAFRHALIAAVLAALIAGLIAWRPARLRDAMRRRIGALVSGKPDPGRPALGDNLNREFERLVRIWRLRFDRLTREASLRPRIMDALPDPVLLIDAERRVTRANNAAREFAGIELTGHDLAAGLRNPDLIEAVDRVLAGERGLSIELSSRVPVDRSFAVRIEPLGGDIPDAAIIAFHDLTALEKTDSIRADFVANVSHELKTPLASLIGYIETLQDSARDDAEARDKFLLIMQDQAGRMTRLIDDLLSLSRIEMAEHARPTDRVDLVSIIEAVMVGLAPKAKRHDVEVRLDLPEALPPIEGDRDQLSGVFENLIDNAIKYGRQGGIVSVGAGAGAGGTVEIRVEDDGPGIPAAHIPRLTERFYRVDADRSRETGGTGLGLAIVKHVVNRHRGRLKIESQPGKGAKFTVILPASGDGG